MCSYTLMPSLDFDIVAKFEHVNMRAGLLYLKQGLHFSDARKKPTANQPLSGRKFDKHPYPALYVDVGGFRLPNHRIRVLSACR